MDQFFFIQLYTKQNRSGNDKFKATKNTPGKYSAAIVKLTWEILNI